LDESGEGVEAGLAGQMQDDNDERSNGGEYEWFGEDDIVDQTAKDGQTFKEVINDDIDLIQVSHGSEVPGVRAWQLYENYNK